MATGADMHQRACMPCQQAVEVNMTAMLGATLHFYPGRSSTYRWWSDWAGKFHWTELLLLVVDVPASLGRLVVLLLLLVPLSCARTRTECCLRHVALTNGPACSTLARDRQVTGVARNAWRPKLHRPVAVAKGQLALGIEATPAPETAAVHRR